jgi:predicted PurR-regulated permease PerM
MLKDKVFVALVIAVSLALAWILWPFFGALFWAAVLATLFRPLYRRLSRPREERRTRAALLTVLIILLVAILPSALIGGMLVREAVGVYKRVQSGEFDVGRYLEQAMAFLPAWIRDWLERFGLTDLGTVQERFSAGLMRGAQVLGTQALNVGQNTLDFVVSVFLMLYVLFFFLRDGTALTRRIREAMPLDEPLQRALFGKFAEVIAATIKGNILVAAVQGALGGAIFWILGIGAAVFWGVVMAFLSLLPVVGTALVWVPAAIYFFLTGGIWRGIVLIAFGVLVIGLVDNVLRPLVVGKDTKMPDWVVLISTLGGMATFGFNGFVIGPVIAAIFIAVWDTAAPRRPAPPPVSAD